MIPRTSFFLGHNSLHLIIVPFFFFVVFCSSLNEERRVFAKRKTSPEKSHRNNRSRLSAPSGPPTESALQQTLKRARKNAALGNFAQAEKLFSKALKMEGCPLLVHREKAEVLAVTGQYVKAYKELQLYKKTLSHTLPPEPAFKTELIRLKRLSFIKKGRKAKPPRRFSKSHPVVGGAPPSHGYVGKKGPDNIHKELAWEINVSGGIQAEPVLNTEGHIFIGSRLGVLYCLDMKGKIIWKKALRGPILHGGALTKKNRLFIVSGLRTLSSIDGATGKTLWERKLSHRISGPPVVDEKGHIGVVAGKLYVFTETGSKLFEWNPKDFYCRSGPVSKHGVWFMGCDDGAVWAKEYLSGKLFKRGRFRCFDMPITISPAISAGNVLVVAGDKGIVCAYSAMSSTEKLWQTATSHRFSTGPAIGEKGAIYIGTNDGKLVVLNAYGQEQTPVSLSQKEPLVSRPLIDKKGKLYQGTITGWLYLLNRNGKILQKRFFGADIASCPALHFTGHLVFGTGNGEIISIR